MRGASEKKQRCTAAPVQKMSGSTHSRFACADERICYMKSSAKDWRTLFELVRSGSGPFSQGTPGLYKTPIGTESLFSWTR